MIYIVHCCICEHSIVQVCWKYNLTFLKEFSETVCQRSTQVNDPVLRYRLANREKSVSHCLFHILHVYINLDILPMGFPFPSYMPAACGLFSGFD